MNREHAQQTPWRLACNSLYVHPLVSVAVCLLITYVSLGVMQRRQIVWLRTVVSVGMRKGDCQDDGLQKTSCAPSGVICYPSTHNASHSACKRNSGITAFAEVKCVNLKFGDVSETRRGFGLRGQRSSPILYKLLQSLVKLF